MTGASGFIGSHLCRKLVKQGQEVVGLSHSGKTERLGSLMANDNFVLVVGDVRDKERVDEIVAYYKPKTIFHLAALVSYMQEKDFLGINIKGTKNLLASAYANGVEEFIYASSMGVYSVPPEVLPVPETHSTKPDTEYGTSKVVGELTCKAMSKSMKVVIVRYAGAYGIGMEPNRVIPRFIRAALKDEPLEVLGNGNQSSDFCYVDDIVSGTILAWQKGKCDESYNIGSGQETRLIDLAQLVVKLTNSKSRIKIGGNKIDRPFRFYLDISKARKELGYEPRKLADGLKNTLRRNRND